MNYSTALDTAVCILTVSCNITRSNKWMFSWVTLELCEARIKGKKKTFTGLEKPLSAHPGQVHFPPRQVNLLSSLAPRARTQARQPPTNLLITIWTEQIFGAWKVFRWILTKITNYSVVLLIGWRVFTVQKWLASMWSKYAMIKVLSATKSNCNQHENAGVFFFL